MTKEEKQRKEKIELHKKRYRDRYAEDEEFKNKALERVRKWRKDNPDKVAEYKRNARIKRGLFVKMTEEEKKAKDKEYGNKYYEENIEVCKKRYRDRYAEDEEFKNKALERNRKWRKDNPDKVAEYARNARIKKGLSTEPFVKMTEEEKKAKAKARRDNKNKK